MFKKMMPSKVSSDDISPSIYQELKSLQTSLQDFAGEKRDLVDVSICALLSSGHVLLEDVPGVGKSTYIKALAKMIGLNMTRVQCTSDLLPSDIVGVEVYEPDSKSFAFHKGPIFTDILFVDELNRASPRTQSALLEAMGEGQVTVDRKTYVLAKPFIVFASQNPFESLGTFALPESQLDRFSAKITVGYPTNDRETAIFMQSKIDPTAAINAPILSVPSLKVLADAVETVHVSPAIAEYVKRIVDSSRVAKAVRVGVSTRGGIVWIRMAKALALLNHRTYIIPDDLQRIAVMCLSHRIVPQSSNNSEDIINELLISTRV